MWKNALSTNISLNITEKAATSFKESWCVGISAEFSNDMIRVKIKSNPFQVRTRSLHDLLSIIVIDFLSLFKFTSFYKKI